jgi:hypothetical protein
MKNEIIKERIKKYKGAYISSTRNNNLVFQEKAVFNTAVKPPAIDLNSIP